MSDRIKELVKRAWEQRDLISPNRALDDAFTDKFAELLIKECLVAIDNTNQHHAHTSFDKGLIAATISKSKESVKDHFGVE